LEISDQSAAAGSDSREILDIKGAPNSALNNTTMEELDLAITTTVESPVITRIRI
jgi:hypothetical protein